MRGLKRQWWSSVSVIGSLLYARPCCFWKEVSTCCRNSPTLIRYSTVSLKPIVCRDGISKSPLLVTVEGELQSAYVVIRRPPYVCH